MITVLRLAGELRSVNYRQFHARWVPPRVRPVCPVQEPQQPPTITPPRSHDPGQGLRPHQPSMVIKMLNGLLARPRDLSTILDQDDLTTSSDLGESYTSEARKGKPPWMGIVRRNQIDLRQSATPPSPKSLQCIGQNPSPVPDDTAPSAPDSAELSSNPEASVEQHDIFRGVMARVEAMTAQHFSISGESELDPLRLQAMRGTEEMTPETDQLELQHQPIPPVSSDEDEINTDSNDDDTTPRMAANPIQDCTTPSDHDGDDTNSPENIGAQPLDQEESPGQDSTLRAEIMDRIESMMAQPVNISGESGSQPLWMQELMRSMQQTPPPLSQPIPPTTPISGSTPAQPIPTTPAQPIPATPTSSFVPTTPPTTPHLMPTTPPTTPPLMPTTPPTTPPLTPTTPPTTPHLMSATPPTTPHLMPTTPPTTPPLVSATSPTPPAPPAPTAAAKRRLASTQSPQEAITKKQKEETSPAVPAKPTRAPVPMFPAPLPAESSFIPVLRECDLEDVLNGQGLPICLGSGAYGEVLLKRRKTDGVMVAVKSLLDVHDPCQEYQDMIKEIRTMMAVQHQQEFPKVWGIINQTSFGIQYVGDEATLTSNDLHTLLGNPSAGSLNTLDWIQICLDVSRGVLALHNAGWSHNDLHCGNIMIWRDPNRSDNWAAKIIDLGQAERIDLPPPALIYVSAEKSWCYHNCLHMPPEVVEGVCLLGIKTDIYSLGRMFQVISNSVADLAAIKDISKRCMVRMPHDRPELVSIIQDIERFQATRGPAVP